jgi:hypothetical protein
MANYRRRNKVKIARQMKEYGKKHKDELKKYCLKHRLKHREELNEKASKYYSRTKQSLAHYHKNPSHYKNLVLKRKYGITLDQFNSMYIAQGTACAICLRKFENNKHTHVDHNHLTGQVRQLLCKECNNGLGNFKESLVNLQRAIEYLQRWSK